jgi:hypothetical protein
MSNVNLRVNHAPGLPQPDIRSAIESSLVPARGFEPLTY